jgi:predicted permease
MMKLPLWRRNQDEELRTELLGHFQMAVQERLDRGESRAEAESAVHREFGNDLLVREVTRQQWGWIWLEQLVQDVRYSARMLVKSPGFTLVALATLALGIGVNTALFSVVNAVLLSPLPYPHPEQLVTLHMSKPNFETGAIPFPNFRDWQAQNQTFSAMALSRSNATTLIGVGETEYVPINFITSDFFSILGVEPLIGRNLAKGEDDIGGPPVVQISEGLWKRKFGSSKDILGKSLNLSGSAYTIIGVIPATFDLQLGTFSATDIYVPLGQWGNNGLKSRRAALGLHGIGRLKPGVTIDQARADMDVVSRNLATAFPDSNTGMKANLIPIKRSMTGRVRPVLLLLLGAVGFVLLIACLNVASLLLARSQKRSREFAIRTALGASRMRMIRQLLTESVLLALAGGALGMLLAWLVTRSAAGILPQDLPRLHDVHLDSRVLLFSLVVSVLAGIAFGLAPAWKTTRPELQSTLQTVGRRASAERHRMQNTLVVLEIATALVLLVGAGLMLRTLMRLWNVDPGFDAHNVMMFGTSLSPSMATQPAAATRASLRELRDTLASTPGVEAVSLRDGSSPMGGEDDIVFWMAGQPRPLSDSEMNWTLRYIVQPSYLRITKIPLLRGRFFGEQDTEKAPVVVVVDDVFAATFFPHQEALGKRVRWGPEPRDEAEIVGIVGHIKQWGLDNDDTQSLRAQMYQGFDQQSDDQIGISNRVIVRTSTPPLQLLASLKHNVQQLNAENTLFDATTMEQVTSATLQTQQLSMILLGSFAGLALLLAAVGIYGVIAYLVGRRTQEFGIRMALGAQRAEVLLMVMTEGARIAAMGVIFGVVVALALTRLMTKMLFGIKPHDPATFAVVSTVLVVIALAACYLPARRAMSVDPMVALRYE